MIKKLSSLCILVILASCVPVPNLKNSELTFRAPSSISEKQELQAYASEIQMGTRSYIKSVLVDIFDVTNTTFIDTNITNRVEFGGGCEQYEPSDIGNNLTVEFTENRCIGGLQVVQKSTNNPMRYAIMAKVCNNLISTDVTLNAARNKIFTNGQWGTVNRANVRKALELFYPAASFENNLVDGLVEIEASSSSLKEAWQGILVAICVSPEWQVL